MVKLLDVMCYTVVLLNLKQTTHSKFPLKIQLSELYLAFDLLKPLDKKNMNRNFLKFGVFCHHLSTLRNGLSILIFKNILLGNTFLFIMHDCITPKNQSKFGNCY